MFFVVFSTERSIKPITYICCSFDTWHTIPVTEGIFSMYYFVVGINNSPHYKKVPSGYNILFADVPLFLVTSRDFFDFHDCFKEIGYYLKCNKESHWLQSLWNVF